MNKYRVLLNGQNFLLSGETDKMGFFTARFVEAANEQAACEMALEVLRKSDRLRTTVQNTADDPPFVTIEEVNQIASFNDVPNLEPGLILYREDSQET